MSLLKFMSIALVTIIVNVAHASPPSNNQLTDSQKTCAFKNSVILGASITAQTAMSIPFYHKLVTPLAIPRGYFWLPPFGPSPVNLFLRNYVGTIAHSTRLNLSTWVTNQDEHLGSSQIQTLLTGTNKDAFDKANSVFGIDVFYWDAISNNCDYGRGFAVEGLIKKFIQIAREKRINLILGTVPHEVPANVLIDSESTGIPGLWYKPEDSCVSSINTTLRDHCSKAYGCYIVDLQDMVAKLNAGEKLRLNNGRAYDLFQLRPDGVHVSIYGAQYVKERIVEAVESAPLVCR